MVRKNFLVWLSVVLALSSITCAPQGEPRHREFLSPPPPADEDAVKPPRDVPPTLKTRIEAAMDNIRSRKVLTTNSFWTVFHGILGMGPDTATLTDPVTGKEFNAIDYITDGRPIRGMRFIPDPDGVDVQTGPQFVGQGHQDQYVAEMVQWGLPADREFLIEKKRYPFEEFLKYSKARARVTEKQELSWAIIIIGQHFGTDIRWTNKFGEDLRFEDLVRYELNAPIEKAACGGTHRLFGLTWVYHLHLRRGGKKVGVWKDVAKKIARYKQMARKFQHPDGSFSTNYVSKLGNATNPTARIGSSGHVLEWLSLALTDDELKEGWVQDAANALALMILDNGDREVEGGALYHAYHGLHIYRTRVFGSTKSLEKIVPLPPKN
jgi:hypothetical protein